MCPLRGVNFYAYSIFGDDLLSVVQGSGVSVLEGLPIMDFYGETIGPQKFVRYIAMSAIEGCPLSEVSLYIYLYYGCGVKIKHSCDNK